MKKSFFLMTVSLLIWAVWTGNLYRERALGTELIVPIKGFDPRSLISGRYIAFQVDYGEDPKCDSLKKDGFRRRETAYLCWKTKEITAQKPENCPVFIRGVCAWGRFKDAVDRYYVPETAADALDGDIRRAGQKDAGGNRYEAVLSVTKDGKAYPKELLINGTPWTVWYAAREK